MVAIKGIFCIIGILLLVSIVSADLNVTSTTGSNYITWSWDTGTNLSSMYIDGRLMCGYDSEIPSITMANITLVFSGAACHKIDIWDWANNTGNNTACITTNASTSYGGGGSNDSGMNMNAVVGIAGGLVGGMVGALFIGGRLKKRKNER